MRIQGAVLKPMSWQRHALRHPTLQHVVWMRSGNSKHVGPICTTELWPDALLIATDI
jgi:hypothetical protein